MPKWVEQYKLPYELVCSLSRECTRVVWLRAPIILEIWMRLGHNQEHRLVNLPAPKRVGRATNIARTLAEDYRRGDQASSII